MCTNRMLPYRNTMKAMWQQCCGSLNKVLSLKIDIGSSDHSVGTNLVEADHELDKALNEDNDDLIRIFCQIVTFLSFKMNVSCGSHHVFPSQRCLVSSSFLLLQIISVATRLLKVIYSAVQTEMATSGRKHNFRFLRRDSDVYSLEPVDHRMKVQLFGATSLSGCANFGLRQLANDNEREFGRGVSKLIHRDFYFRATSGRKHNFRFLRRDSDVYSLEPVDHRMKVQLFGATSLSGCANFGLRQLANDNEREFGRGVSKLIHRDFYVNYCLPTVK
ncbi:hypothetical protein MAR_031736 [Mya arenaria]|uniref:Uncharacterized protein n=1 Tax=Mya arenaria TaxID=6604 RepID=A0ABY7F7Y9_MYAAR|nr:hypothetical protein MAR_031736 [Mya arenaria]